MLYSQLLGEHGLREGGTTIQDLLDVLKSIPLQARHNFIMVEDSNGNFYDVRGLHFAQSDQAEKWDFKVYLKTDIEGK